MDFVRAYDLVASFLDGQARLAVVGGVGLHGDGVTRTVDLDLVTEAAVQGPLLTLLESGGYETLHASPGYSSHLRRGSAIGRIDVIYVEGATAQALFEGCLPLLTLGKRQALVPRPEYLAAMKVLAMKNDPEREPQDLADIQAVLRLPQVDRMEVRGYFESAGLGDRYEATLRSLGPARPPR